MKFIHTSDWQLGMTRWFLELDGGEAQARFHESRLNAIDRIGELAISEGCLLYTSDLPTICSV